MRWFLLLIGKKVEKVAELKNLLQSRILTVLRTTSFLLNFNSIYSMSDQQPPQPAIPLKEDIEAIVEHIEAEAPGISQGEATILLQQASNSPEKTLTDLVHLFATRQEFRNYVLKASGLQAKERAFGTYYKREYALQLKPFLDIMIANESKQKDTRFLLANFPNTKLKTLRARIEQSFKFVVRELDPLGNYLNFKDKVEVCMEPDGIYIRWRANLRKRQGELVGEMVEIKEDWRERLDTYLTTATLGQTFEEKVSFTEDQVKDLTANIEQLNGPTSFLWACNISQHLIKIVKVGE